MKRLLICTPSHNLQGGVERIIESLARELPQRGFETIFGLAKGTRFNDPDRFRAAFPGIPSVDIDGTSGTPFGRREAMRRTIERVDPDLVLIARLYDAYPAAAELKLRGRRVRLTVTLQTYEQEYFVDAYRYREFIDLCVSSGKLITRAASEIAGIPPDRIVNIPGGAAPAIRERTHSDVLRLGYVARITTVQKRALDLADTLAELRRRGVPFRCVVAGGGSEEAELRRRTGDNAQFLGWLDHDALYRDVYPQLDVLLHFAEWEGLPIAPREAMANGVVPVMARFKGLRIEEEIRDGVNALTFDVGDTNGAADLVERLHHDRALLTQLSANARASQGGIRSESGAADAWARAFEETLARPARTGALPHEPRIHGRLDRLLTPGGAERLRRMIGKRYIHAEAGSEWPHWSGIPDEEIAARIDALSRELA